MVGKKVSLIRGEDENHQIKRKVITIPHPQQREEQNRDMSDPVSFVEDVARPVSLQELKSQFPDVEDLEGVLSAAPHL